MQPVVSIAHFSDLLCIWAYVGEIRLQQLRENFAERIELDHRFIPVFGSTRTKIVERWAGRGGLPAYAAHVHEVVAGFDHVTVHPDVWQKNVPAGSLGAHAFCKAAGMVAADSLEKLTLQLRLAFFRDLRDISRLDVQCEVAASLDLPVEQIRARLEDGSALAALAEDHETAERRQVSGSPTLVLNEGRQTLYGNVGYRVIDANIQELLRDNRDRASWC